MLHMPCVSLSSDVSRGMKSLRSVLFFLLAFPSGLSGVAALLSPSSPSRLNASDVSVSLVDRSARAKEELGSEPCAAALFQELVFMFRADVENSERNRANRASLEAGAWANKTTTVLDLRTVGISKVDVDQMPPSATRAKIDAEKDAINAILSANEGDPFEHMLTLRAIQKGLGFMSLKDGIAAGGGFLFTERVARAVVRCLVPLNKAVIEKGELLQDGRALVQGDIVKPEEGSEAETRMIEGARSSGNRWDRGMVPYCFHNSTSMAAKNAFTLAVAHIKTQVHCLTFEHVSISVAAGESCDRVPSIMVRSDQDGCWSHAGITSDQAGLLGRSQPLNLGIGCEVMGIAAHELGHALSLLHEMGAGADRDDLSLMFLPPDHEKVTEINAFKLNPFKPQLAGHQGQRLGFSEMDVEHLGVLYNCRANAVAPISMTKALSKRLRNGPGFTYQTEDGQCMDEDDPGFEVDGKPCLCEDLDKRCHDPAVSEPTKQLLQKLCAVSCMMCPVGRVTVIEEVVSTTTTTTSYSMMGCGKMKLWRKLGDNTVCTDCQRRPFQHYVIKEVSLDLCKAICTDIEPCRGVQFSASQRHCHVLVDPWTFFARPPSADVHGQDLGGQGQVAGVLGAEGFQCYAYDCGQRVELTPGQRCEAHGWRDLGADTGCADCHSRTYTAYRLHGVSLQACTMKCEERSARCRGIQYEEATGSCALLADAGATMLGQFGSYLQDSGMSQVAATVHRVGSQCFAFDAGLLVRQVENSCDVIESNAVVLNFEIVGAFGLKHSDLRLGLSTSDAFCTADVLGRNITTFRTQVVSTGMAHAVYWNAPHTFDHFPMGDEITFKCWDKDFTTQDQLLGKTELRTSEFYPFGFDGNLTLENGNETALLHVRVSRVSPQTKAPTPAPTVPPPPPPIPPPTPAPTRTPTMQPTEQRKVMLRFELMKVDYGELNELGKKEFADRVADAIGESVGINESFVAVNVSQNPVKVSATITPPRFTTTENIEAVAKYSTVLVHNVIAKLNAMEGLSEITAMALDNTSVVGVSVFTETRNEVLTNFHDRVNVWGDQNCERWVKENSKRCYTERYQSNCYMECAAAHGINSGDNIYLRMHTGTYIDVEGESVKARWPQHGGWSRLVIEKGKAGPIFPDDAVSLRAHSGSYVYADYPHVRAINNATEARTLVIERKGLGPIKAGDTIRIKSKTGFYIDIVGGDVGALWSSTQASQELRIEAEATGNLSFVFSYGSEDCPCVGIAGESGTVPVQTLAGLMHYPVETGSYCYAWDEGRHDGNCTSGDGLAGHGKEWCSKAWCYVDPCSCNIPKPSRPSEHRKGALFQGHPLHYSYATCGSVDNWRPPDTCEYMNSKESCESLVKEGVIKDERKCGWVKDKCMAVELKATCSTVSDAAKYGSQNCQCVGIDGNSGVHSDHTALHTTFAINHGLMTYDVDVGGKCHNWDLNHHAECKEDDDALSGHQILPAWCYHKWCYVDPCSCNASVSLETYFSGTFRGRDVHRSYSTCGGVELEEESCIFRLDMASCQDAMHLCAWTGHACVKLAVAEACSPKLLTFRTGEKAETCPGNRFPFPTDVMYTANGLEQGSVMWSSEELASLESIWKVNETWSLSATVTSSDKVHRKFGFAAEGGFMVVDVPAGVDKKRLEVTDNVKQTTLPTFSFLGTGTARGVSFTNVCLKEMCSDLVEISGAPEGSALEHYMGTYTLSGISSTSDHGGREIYNNKRGKQLFYRIEGGMWLISDSGGYAENTGTAFSAGDVWCPTGTVAWHVWNGSIWESHPNIRITATTNRSESTADWQTKVVKVGFALLGVAYKDTSAAMRTDFRTRAEEAIAEAVNISATEVTATLSSDMVMEIRFAPLVDTSTDNVTSAIQLAGMPHLIMQLNKVLGLYHFSNSALNAASISGLHVNIEAATAAPELVPTPPPTEIVNLWGDGNCNGWIDSNRSRCLSHVYMTNCRKSCVENTNVTRYTEPGVSEMDVIVEALGEGPEFYGMLIEYERKMEAFLSNLRATISSTYDILGPHTRVLSVDKLEGFGKDVLVVRVLIDDLSMQRIKQKVLPLQFQLGRALKADARLGTTTAPQRNFEVLVYPFETQEIDNSPGVDPKTRQLLNNCQGDCDAHTDCRAGLKCFMHTAAKGGTAGGSAGVPGCRGLPNAYWDYCFEERCGSPSFQCTEGLVKTLAAYPETLPNATKCCEETCSAKSFQCAGGWAKAAGASFLTTPTTAKCCEEVCGSDTFACPSGWAKVASAYNRTKPEASKCCERTCADFSCGKAWSMKANGSKLLSPSRLQCCEEDTIRVFVFHKREVVELHMKPSETIDQLKAAYGKKAKDGFDGRHEFDLGGEILDDARNLSSYHVQSNSTFVVGDGLHASAKGMGKGATATEGFVTKMVFKLLNIDFAKLTDVVEAQISVAITEGVVVAAQGSGLTDSAITVHLFPSEQGHSSIWARVTIRPPQGATARNVTQVLRERRGALMSGVLQLVQLAPDLEAASAVAAPAAAWEFDVVPGAPAPAEEVVAAAAEEGLSGSSNGSGNKTASTCSRACSGWVPSVGAFAGKGGSCQQWGWSRPWCYVEKHYCGAWNEFVEGSKEYDGRFFAPCDDGHWSQERETTPHSCEDFPADWKDKAGDACANYGYGWCTKEGGIGPSWRAEHGHISDYAHDGVDAFHACCACGGGRQQPALVEHRAADTTSPDTSKAQRGAQRLLRVEQP